MKLILLIILGLSANLSDANEIQPFEATYEIIRGGKVTGKQTTVLEQISDNHWSIKDTIIGTSGMASLIGFKRIETTEFEYINNDLMATHHQMKQKAAFSNREYTFTWLPEKSIYSIIYKDQTDQFDPQGKAIISAQLMPMALALAACKQQYDVELLVLKNKMAKPYQFQISNTEKLIAERKYSGEQSKISKTWLDPERQCLPIEQSHQDGNEPNIITKLIDFKWL